MKTKTVTAVRVTKAVWREIQDRKDVGQTADDVIREAFELPKNKGEN